jgi:hypothetical protein
MQIRKAGYLLIGKVFVPRQAYALQLSAAAKNFMPQTGPVRDCRTGSASLPGPSIDPSGSAFTAQFCFGSD